jgi:hypothetical protein
MDHFYLSGFVCSDTLAWEAVPGALILRGEIGCKGDIVIGVFKLIAVVDPDGDLDNFNVEVQTIRYAYNAFVRGAGNLLRHDNAHAQPGHPDSHHRHEFDWQTDQELDGFPRWCGIDGWPTLGDFIEEISVWYWKHREELPRPDSEPILGLR